MKRLRKGDQGFTLIEVMIIILLISILALILIPRLMSATRRAKEAALHEDLGELRNAIQHFQADTGAYPPALTDLMVASGADVSADQDGSGMSVDRAAYRGPYLRTGDGTLPLDPFTAAADWAYDNALGEVHSVSNMTALGGGSTYDTW